MANTTSSKGNPASHRMSNPNLKARRQRCWNNSQSRKERNRNENAARFAANKGTRALGTYEVREAHALRSGTLSWLDWLTPHEAQRLARRLRRDEMRKQGTIPANAEQYDKKHPKRMTGKVTVPSHLDTKKGKKA